MPSRIFNAPDDLPVISDLRVGPTAAVFVSDAGEAVAVSARDGSYRALSLPGFVGRQTPAGEPRLVVSPDGNELAYAWNDEPPAVSGSHVDSGIRVVNLINGRVRTFDIAGGLAAQCGRLSWSSSSRFIVAVCWINDSFDQHGSQASARVDRLDLLRGTHVVVPILAQDGGIAVNDEGAVVLVSGNSAYFWSRGQQVAEETFRKSVSSAGTVAWQNPHDVVIASSVARAAFVQHFGYQPDPCLTCSSPLLSPRTAQDVSGWVEDLSRVSETTVELVSMSGGRIHLLTWSTQEGPIERVSVDAGTYSSDYSFAAELLQRPTRDTPDPNVLSAWDQLRKALPYVSVGLLLLLAAMLGVVRRRKQRLRQV
jgi:hypothetical protein